MVVVNNTTELTTELNNATGGETIQLAAGFDAGTSQYQTPTKTFSSRVNIESLDTNNKGTFSKIKVNCGPVTFQDVAFVYVWQSGDGNEEFIVRCTNGVDGVYFDNCRFVGDTGNAPDRRGWACDFRSLDDIRVTNSYFQDWKIGIYFDRCTNTVFDDNEYTGGGGDSLRYVAGSDHSIQRNHFHSWATIVGAPHVDVIQLQHSAASNAAVNRLDFIENVVDQADGDRGQMIWAGLNNRDLNNANHIHRDIVIRDNILINGHVNGIGLTGVTNLTMEQNLMQLGVNGGGAGEGEPVVALNTCVNVVADRNIWPGYGGPAVAGTNYVLTQSDWGSELTRVADGPVDGYTDFRIESGNTAHTGLAGSRMMKRAGGWAGAEITPHPSYLGGNSGATPLPILPSGSVAATVTVP